MTHRIGLLAGALVVALLGTMAVLSYVNRVEASAIADAQPVDVLVARDRIASGTTGAVAAQRKLVELVKLPRKAVPEGALSSLDKVDEQSLVSDVFAGEVLLAAKFATQTARTGDLLIPKDKIAVSVELEDPQRVAGFVVPGSEVAVFATIKKVEATAKATASHVSATSATVSVQAEGDDDYTSLLLPRASVIAVGPATLRAADNGKKKKSKDEVTTAVLTLAVDQQDAQRLVHSAQTGDLWFGLLSSTSKTGPANGVSNANLFPNPGGAR
jgi:pilus assembly protein CpaB